VNTIADKVIGGRRRRRTHSPEFKAHAVAQCRHTGVSIAAVAMANGINANLLRRWVAEAEQGMLTDHASTQVPQVGASKTKPASQGVGFVALQLPAPAAVAPADIRIEMARGPTTITVSWPCSAALECAAWMREVLR
jgi:transposase